MPRWNADVAAVSPAPANPWTTLQEQWQELGMQWAHWWAQAAANAPTTTAGILPLGNAGIALPALPPVWIDPGAAAELTEQFNRKLEALLLHCAQGTSPVDTAGVHDRRFASREWRQQPYFAMLKDAYLLYAEYLNSLVRLAEADATAKKRLGFLVQQYLDAIAPSNFLATNPDALKRALESGGASLAKGLSNLAADAQRGRIAMTDESAFAVGVNLAITPGSVVYRNELIELIQYAPTTARVHRRPLVMIPPCINKYYILDLQPENSFVRHAIAQGHTVFMVSWRNIPGELASLHWDDYLERGVMMAIDVARDISASKTVNALGFCVGGTLLACALAVLAARRTNPVSSLTLLTTMLDYSDPGDIGVYISRDALASREPVLLAGGRVQGSELANAFASLRPNDLVWNYVVGNYLKGETPPAFDLLYWNGDSTNLPGPMYYEYVSNMYVDNRLREPGVLHMCGEAVDLGRIAVPTYLYASREDHIVPWRTAYRSTALLGGDLTFVLGASGHIAGVINPPSKGRRNYWTNELLTDEADDWLARSERQQGSWWPHWSSWLAGHGGSQSNAPAREGNVRHRPVGAAPGTYVKERAD
jgi:polyhydroxyalkanoate synthase subunit PhaC